MSRFVYLLSEGVHDVAFLSRVLKHAHGASKVDLKSKLDGEVQVQGTEEQEGVASSGPSPIEGPVFLGLLT